MAINHSPVPAGRDIFLHNGDGLDSRINWTRLRHGRSPLFTSAPMRYGVLALCYSILKFGCLHTQIRWYPRLDEFMFDRHEEIGLVHYLDASRALERGNVRCAMSRQSFSSPDREDQAQ